MADAPKTYGCSIRMDDGSPCPNLARFTSSVYEPREDGRYEVTRWYGECIEHSRPAPEERAVLDVLD